MKFNTYPRRRMTVPATKEDIPERLKFAQNKTLAEVRYGDGLPFLTDAIANITSSCYEVVL